MSGQIIVPPHVYEVVKNHCAKTGDDEYVIACGLNAGKYQIKVGKCYEATIVEVEGWTPYIGD